VDPKEVDAPEGEMRFFMLREKTLACENVILIQDASSKPKVISVKSRVF
jgi:hypothetical protein